MSAAELRKAAVLLMSLSEEEADRLLERLNPREIEAVTAEMARVEDLSNSEQEAVILEFAQAEATGAPPVEEHTVDEQLPPAESAPPAIEPAQPVAAQPFEFLRRVNCGVLADALIDERPQTIAAIASHLPASYGAELIGCLGPDVQLAVIRAVATTEPMAAETLRDLAGALESQLADFVG